MKFSLDGNGNLLTVSYQFGDKSVSSESQLFYRIKQELNKQFGLDLIKKLMYKDGHMVSGTDYYLRTRKPSQRFGKPDIYVTDYYSNLRNLFSEYKEYGYVSLNLYYDVFSESGNNSKELLSKLMGWGEGQK